MDSRGNSVLDQHFHQARQISERIRGLLAALCPNQTYRDDLDAMGYIELAVNCLRKPEYTEGQLRRQSNGRWLLSQQGDTEFSSGSPLEVWDGQAWIPTRIEHSRERGGYYRIDGGPLRDGDWVRVPR